MKKLSAFSLMEMMVVLLIVSIVAAASAPMVNKKLLTQASEKSPWVWTGTNNNIAYNLNNAEQTAIIGGVNPPSAASNAKLYIDTKAGSNGVYRPQISFGHDSGANVMSLFVNKRSIWFTDKAQPIVAAVAHNNSVIMGYGAWGVSSNTTAIGANTKFQDNSTAIGYGANASGNGIAIGKVANASQSGSIAIGSGTAGLANETMDTRASGIHSIAIGRSAFASGKGAISIGGANDLTITTASGDNSIAIGRDATNATSSNSIAIGKQSHSLSLDSIAMGALSNASSSYAIALGVDSNASGSSSVCIGRNAQSGSSSNSVALGPNAGNSISTPNSVAIGANTKPSDSAAIAIGFGATAGKCSIAIGSSNMAHRATYRTRATGENSIAIGNRAVATFDDSVAIGHSASTSTSNQIVLGTSNDTIYIPGRLVVGYDALLNLKKGQTVVRRGNEGKELCVFRSEDLRGGDDNLREYPTDIDNTTWFNTYISDRRLKNIGKAFTSGLDKIRKLEVFNYTFKDDKSKTPHVGVMAQDLQKIFPDAVIKGEDGFLRIRMEDMFYALVNSVKELAVKFESHDQKIEELTKQNLELQREIAGLEKRIARLEKK